MYTVRNTALLALLLAAACGGANPSDVNTPLESARDNQQHAVTRRGAGGMADGKADDGKGDDDSGGGERGDGKEAGTEADEMAAMPPEVAKFHDALAPRWHAEHGAKRMAATCAAVGELRGDAEAIAKLAAPAGSNASDWAASARQLGEALDGLDAACKAHDAARFEPAFARVHDRFHGVMHAAAAGHGDADRDK